MLKQLENAHICYSLRIKYRALKLLENPFEYIQALS